MRARVWHYLSAQTLRWLLVHPRYARYVLFNTLMWGPNFGRCNETRYNEVLSYVDAVGDFEDLAWFWACVVHLMEWPSRLASMLSHTNKNPYVNGNHTDC